MLIVGCIYNIQENYLLYFSLQFTIDIFNRRIQRLPKNMLKYKYINTMTEYNSFLIKSARLCRTLKASSFS